LAKSKSESNLNFESSRTFGTSAAFRDHADRNFGGSFETVVDIATTRIARRDAAEALAAGLVHENEAKQRSRFYGGGTSLSHNGGWFLHRGDLCYQLETDSEAREKKSRDTREALMSEWTIHHTHTSGVSTNVCVRSRRMFGVAVPRALSPLRRAPLTHADIKDPDCLRLQKSPTRRATNHRRTQSLRQNQPDSSSSLGKVYPNTISSPKKLDPLPVAPFPLRQRVFLLRSLESAVEQSAATSGNSFTAHSRGTLAKPVTVSL
jgi:hypothetical protein